ncbi:MAG: YcxB family protein [Oscillospiraceae bacterium]|nr:YcxB family protein [Oscillospiraceae bacterium]
MEPENELIEEERAEELPEEAREEAVPALEEPQFAAKTVLNAELQLEASKAVSPKLPRVISIFLIVFAAAAVGVLFWLYFAKGDKNNLLMAILLIPLVGYMVYSRIAMPKKAMQRWEQKMIAGYGCKELHLLTEFFDKALAQTVQETGELTTEGYSAVVELKETEHLFLLRHSAQQWYFVEKSDFTVGTADGFRAFITERIGG